MTKTNKTKVIKKFDFPEGFEISKKFKVIQKLGEGWEGEVYKVVETATGIERAAKFFLPHRNKKNMAARFYAKKLHKLRHCPILIQYLIQETIKFQGVDVTYLISEYVEGEPLAQFLKRQKNKRLNHFQALHLLHALARGIEDIHRAREYHGDLHSDNIIVRRYGLGFDLKLLDMFHWGTAKPENLKDDIVDLINVFYEALGGRRYYPVVPQQIKNICSGLKKSLILKKFRTVSQLREHLENLSWEE